LNILDAGALRATFFAHSVDKETERRLGDRDQVFAFLDVDVDCTWALFTEVWCHDFKFGVANPVDLRSFFPFVTYFEEKAPLAWTLMEAFALDDHWDLAGDWTACGFDALDRVGWTYDLRNVESPHIVEPLV